MGIFDKLFGKKSKELEVKDIKKVKGYIVVGTTVILDKNGTHYYRGVAWEHFEKSNESFRKFINAKKMSVETMGVKVEGNANSNIDDIVNRATVKLREWQPTLHIFNFNVNHFYCGGYSKIQSTNQAFKWAVIFHFE